MGRWKRALWMPAAAAVMVAAAAAGCGGSAGAASSGGSKTYTVGVLTDLTGPGSTINATTPTGVKAGVYYAKAHGGYTIKYVVGDTATNPGDVVSVAQKLVEVDHAFAIVAASALTFEASSWLTAHGIPVVGAAEDGPEWLTSKNMFSSLGAINTKLVTTIAGEFFKMEGVTELGTLGYGISPSSAEAAEGDAASAEHYGIKAPYVNADFQYGSTNVAPVALAMKSDGVNGVAADTDFNTEFALLGQLKQQGVGLKAALLPTGYGGDLLAAGSGAEQAAQGVYFLSSFEPVEMHTAATEEFQKDLKKAGVKTDPTYAEYCGYTAMVLLDQGLQGAGKKPTQASLIKSLTGIKAFTAGGLTGTHTLDMNVSKQDGAGVGCYWITRYEGSKFDLVKGDDPLCGKVIPGVTVSPPAS